MKRVAVILLGLLISVWTSRPVNYGSGGGDNINPAVPNLKFAGARSSGYGIKPFPSPVQWEQALRSVTSHFQEASPSAIWVVGVINGSMSCRLEFPAGIRSVPHINFLDYDKHEAYLSHFDKAGIQVFLQVEPAHADVLTLIDLVLDRYKHHPCIKGLGVDVEWYREADFPKRGKKIDDSTARSWEAGVKRHHPEYRLFLKHWDRKWMPPNYRGDIIFVDDSQMFKSLDHMTREFVDYWAEYFKPNTVFFQIGYPKDRLFWQNFRIPPKFIGMHLAKNISQECGIFWVDFTLRSMLQMTSKAVGPPAGNESK